MPRRRKQRYPLVLVEWDDSARPNPAWVHVTDLPKPKVIGCLSVGWVIQETRRVLVLAPNIGDAHSKGNGQVCGYIRIPVAAITRRAELTEAA